MSVLHSYNLGMDSTQNCSILIPYFNKPASIGQVLDSIITCKHELEPWTLCEIIILIDGCPPPEMNPLPIVRFILLDNNSGLSKARNRLIQEAKGDFIIFLDADAVLMPKSLKALVLQWDGKSLIAGQEQSSPEISLADKFRKYFWVQTQGPEPIPTAPYFFGIIFAAPRDMLLEIGPFNINMPNFGEDIDYSLRLLKAGHNIQYEPKLCVFHDRQDSIYSLWVMVFQHSKNQILAHIQHECSIMNILWQSFKWVFIAPGSALKSHRSFALFVVAAVFCVWSFTVKLIYSLVGVDRRHRGVEYAQ